MRIGDVIGTVTLNRAHPTMQRASFKLVTPLSWENLAGRQEQRLEEIVVYDQLGAGVGCRVAISEGREAAMPFHPEAKPVDAYNAAILDSLDYETPEHIQRIPLAGHRPKVGHGRGAGGEGSRKQMQNEKCKVQNEN